MNEKPSYYAIIPANIRYDNTLRANEKLMYGEITALSSKYGICTASNNYFAKLYDVQPSAISRWIKDLKERGYIDISYITDGKEVVQREIKLIGIHKNEYVFTNEEEGYSQKDEDNNTSNNNTSKKEIYKEKRFIKPTLEEIETYCKERNNNVNPKTFYEYFETGNWIDSKGNKVKNWKQKIITWEKSNQTKNNLKVSNELPNWEIKEEEKSEELKDFLKRIGKDN